MTQGYRVSNTHIAIKRDDLAIKWFSRYTGQGFLSGEVITKMVERIFHAASINKKNSLVEREYKDGEGTCR
jgi:hypothetical protein